VRLVRVVALILVVVAALVAQLLFDGKPLGGVGFVWLRHSLPGMVGLPVWEGQARVGLAAWLSCVALTGVGLLAPAWHGEQGRIFRRPHRVAQTRPWWLAWVMAAATTLLTAAAVVLTVRMQPGAAWLWMGSVATLIASGWAIQQQRSTVVYASRYAEAVNPERGWPYLVLILLLATGLYLFRMPDLPARVDLPTAGVGLAARAWQDGDATGFFSRDPVPRPLPTLLVTSGVLWLSGDSLWGVRLAGLIGALATIGAVWLLGCELFRRVPAYELFGEVVEDDGRWMALLAAMTLASSVVLYRFGRVPVQLEPVAWGALGLWALLRGLRLEQSLLLAVSAGCLGWAALYGPVGWVFAAAALWTWLGVALWEPAWLQGKTVAPRAGGDPVRIQQGVGRIGFGLWLGGFFLATAPLSAAWLTDPTVRFAPWAWWGMANMPTPLGWLDRLTITLLAFVQPGGMPGFNAHFVHSLLMPVLVLGLGALILAIDSVMGWSLTTWSVTGVVAAALLAPALPNWTAMLALLPMVSLVAAFGLDRLRVMVMTTLGTWSLQATVYLAVGVIIAAGLFGWIAYYGYAQRDTDLATAMARAIDTAGQRPVILVSGSMSPEETVQSEVVRMLVDDAAALERVTTVAAPEWSAVAPDARLLVAPGDWIQVRALESAYPDGQLTVMRDVRANPVLYVYDLSPAK